MLSVYGIRELCWVFLKLVNCDLVIAVMCSHVGFLEFYVLEKFSN